MQQLKHVFLHKKYWRHKQHNWITIFANLIDHLQVMMPGGMMLQPHLLMCLYKSRRGQLVSFCLA